MSDTVGKLGGYEITKFDIHSHNTFKSSLIDKIASFTLYEDISSPSLTAKITIVDDTGAINYFPIIGQERVDFSFKTSGSDSEINLEFNIVKISDMKDTGPATQAYNLQLVTTDFIRNFETRICETFDGSSVEIGQRCFDKLGSIKSLSIEQSDDRYEQETALLIPNMTPFRAMTFLCQKAFSETYKSSSYLFFETTNSYMMKPLESFVNAEAKNNFVVGPLKNTSSEPITESSGQSDPNQENKKVISYDFESSFDVLNNITKGMYVGNATTVDFITRNSKKLTHSFWDNYSEYQIMNDGPFQSFDGQSRKYLPQTNYLVPEKELNGTSIYNQEKIFLRRLFYKQLMNNIKCTITVFGDSDLTLGDMINLQIPLYSSTDSGEIDRYYSGKYLILALRHRLELGRYYLDIELVKDSFNDTLPSPIPELVR